MAKDYYAVLGVPRNASDKQIRQAYRRLARKYHPDVNAGNKESESRFKGINEAYEVVSDPDKRAKYDQFGENWRHAERRSQETQAPGGRPFTRTFHVGHQSGRASTFGNDGLGLDDIFAEFLGGRRNRAASAAEVTVEISLEEAYLGTRRVVVVPSVTRGGPARNLEVKIPKGVATGSRVHVAAEGVSHSGINLNIRVQTHPQFQRKGDNLYTDIQVPVEDVALGTEIEVPTLKGRVLLKVPPETQNGRVFRLAGRGMPRLNDSSSGNLYATIKVALPSPMSERQRELFRELRGLRDTT